MVVYSVCLTLNEPHVVIGQTCAYLDVIANDNSTNELINPRQAVFGGYCCASLYATMFHLLP